MSASVKGDAGNTPALRDAEPESTNDPPPEPPKSLWTRCKIIAAFWAVVFFLGVPHWIWTTSIHRSPLPLELMNGWTDGTACQMNYPLHLRLVHANQSFDEMRELARQIHLLSNAQVHSTNYFYWVSDNNGTSLSSSVPAHQYEDHEIALTVQLVQDAAVQSMQATLQSWTPSLDVRYPSDKAVNVTTLSSFIANEVRSIFEEEMNTVPYILSNSPFQRGHYLQKPSPDVKENLEAKRTRAFKYASTYHLTFSLFTSSASPSAWDIEAALAESINPLLDRLSAISQFTVDTQVQFYASFSPSIAGPQYDASTRTWKLQRSDLSGFINAAEWPLNPGIGSGPTINFVLYVPAKEQSPLILAETGGNSWLIPQWGGVQILNPTGKQPDKLTAEDLRPVMLTFADQLSSLLGLPQSPRSLSLRIASLTRERAISLMISASSTLGALARLTLKLTSIAIPDSVAKSVDETIRRLDEACSDLQTGHYHDALVNARIAEDEAEQAFFEPSMVGQVYFPEEHKVAVYVPLLGPVAVPLVMALVKFGKDFRKLRNKKSKEA